MIRGHRYDQIGSAGAMTLLALAWELTIFEETIERGQGHPGFLLIDSPQKNLRPGTVAAQTPPAGDEDDVSDADIAINAASIVDRVYAHITTWLAENSGRAQILMVDNEPPASVPESAIAVRYGGSTGAPPYGLIDDAID